jgi:hypothetical protein
MVFVNFYFVLPVIYHVENLILGVYVQVVN